MATPFNLICTREFHDRANGKTYKIGDVVTDPRDVARFQDDREHHFVRIPGDGTEQK